MAGTRIQVEDVPNTDAGPAWEEALSSTASMTNSIRNYRKENGRTYHAYHDGAYNYPNDEAENDRLDLQHHLWYLTLHGKLQLCSPNAKGRVLDVGTGTGIWAVDFADEHPDSTVIGVDLSPTQPGFVPPNVTFQVDDVEDEWTFGELFDYIHSRAMNGSITNWPAFLQKCHANLKPGGVLEIQEFGLGTADDDTMGPDTALAQSVQILIDGGKSLAHPFIDVSTLKALVEDAGFAGVAGEPTIWPGNGWPRDPRLKELGMWNNANVKAGIEGFILAVGTRGLGLAPEELIALAARCREELDDRRVHSYWPINVVYAQKVA